MDTSWHHSPGSRQYWLCRGSENQYLVGMVHERNFALFDVYIEHKHHPNVWNNRELVATVPTLDEAKGLLQTLIGAQA